MRGAAPIPRGDRRGRRRLRLSEVPISAKLALLVVPPVLGILVLAAVAAIALGALPWIGERHADLRPVAATAVAGADVAEALYQERLVATLLLHHVPEPPTGEPDTEPDQAQTTAATPDPGITLDSARAQYANRAAATDTAIERYRAARSKVDRADPLNSRLARIDAGVAGLAGVRADAVARRQEVPASTILLAYRDVLADLVALREAVARRDPPAEAAVALRSAAWLSVARDAFATAQIAVLRADRNAGLTQSGYEELVASLGAYRAALGRFDAEATADWRAQVARAVAEPDAPEGQTLDTLAARAPVGRPLWTDTTPAAWTSTSGVQLQRLRAVEEAVDRTASARVEAAATERSRLLTVAVAVVLATLLLLAALTIVIRNALARPLHELRTAALRVANEGLPRASISLRGPVDADGDVVTDPLPVNGTDEIALLVAAFNGVHREALRLAAEQATLRTGVSAVYLSLARRSQRLLDAVLSHVDVLEQHETNPDRLAALFRLDHLISQMRRSNDSLLVLAGTPVTRMRQYPASLVDVVRAAASQVDNYQRVEYVMVDESLGIAPHAVDAFAHLIAELLDNAIRYSPPDTSVIVDARRSGDGALVRVVDGGIGVPEEQLTTINRRLASPTPLDIADARTMGLAVVARLAAQHRIEVRLVHGPSGGTVAELRLPPALVKRGGQQPEVPMTPPVDRVDSVDDEPTRIIEPARAPVPVERPAAVPVERPAPIPVPAEALLPRRTPMAELATGVPEPGELPDPDVTPPDEDEAQQLLSSYQHALGRYGHLPLPSGSTGQWEPE